MASIVLCPVEAGEIERYKTAGVIFVDILFPQENVTTHSLAELGSEGTHHDLASHFKSG
jgi:hypothetical protein